MKKLFLCTTIGLAAIAFDATAVGISSVLLVGVVDQTGICNHQQHLSATGSDVGVACSGLNWSMTAQASSKFGDFRALADFRFDNFDLGSTEQGALFEAKATSAFGPDTLTFNKGVFWEVTIGVSGRSDRTLGGRPTHENSGDFCFSLFGFCGSSASTNQLGLTTEMVRLPPSGSLDIDPSLIVDLFTDLRRNFEGTSTGPLNFEVFVDLLHTVRFVSSRVLDANGVPISDATISSTSGFDYLHPPQPVPAPAALINMLLGLAGLLARYSTASTRGHAERIGRRLAAMVLRAARRWVIADSGLSVGRVGGYDSARGARVPFSSAKFAYETYTVIYAKGAPK